MKFKILLLLMLMGSFGAPIQAAGNQVGASGPDSQNQQTHLLSGSSKKFIHGALLGGLGYNACRYIVDSDRPTLISGITYNLLGLAFADIFYDLSNSNRYRDPTITKVAAVLPACNLLLSLQKNWILTLSIVLLPFFQKTEKFSNKKMIKNIQGFRKLFSSHAQYMLIHYLLLYSYWKVVLKNNRQLDRTIPYCHIQSSWKGCNGSNEKVSFVAGSIMGALAAKRALPFSRKYFAKPIAKFVTDIFGAHKFIKS